MEKSEAADTLNIMGDNGWELVSIIPMTPTSAEEWIFKRRISRAEIISRMDEDYY